MTYPDIQLFIAGEWRDAADGRTLAVLNPATGREIGRVAHAGKADLDLALRAVRNGFETLRHLPAADRSKLMRAAAGPARERAGCSPPVRPHPSTRALCRSFGRRSASSCYCPQPASSRSRSVLL